jgi:type IV secretory pathway ATPase VirB11/archaellum biosynthesis ATPase
MPPRVLERLRHAIARPSGMVLVTGPTGSGKTTTLYAALNELNTTERRSSPSKTRSNTGCPASTRCRCTRRST